MTTQPETTQPTTPTHRPLARALAVTAALAMLGSACGNNTEASDAARPATEVTTPADPVSSTAVLSPVSDNAEPAGPEVEEAPPSGDSITISAAIEWDADSGEFEITDGADALGCESGSFADEGLATSIERVYTCEVGDRTGTFAFHFRPEPAEEGQFTSDWTVEGATDDFAGLEGEGDWVAVVNDADTGADEIWTGEISFGTPDDDVSAASDAEAETFDGDLAGLLADRVEHLEVPDGNGAIMVAVIKGDGTSVSAVGGSDPAGSKPSPADPFRVGSITKVFTSLTTLSLVDDGLLALDDRAADHISRVSVPDDVTVRDLLQHTSGIANYTDVDGFFDTIIEDPERQWTPEEMIEIVSEQEGVGEPGGEMSYSNTNYILLGILIEELTGQPAHQVVRDRIIEPVGMPTTYLSGAEDGPSPVGAYSNFGDRPLAPLDFDYTSIATSAWTAGAMVSSADDLHRMFTALFDGRIIEDDTRAEMIANEEYGLGIEPWDPQDTLVGHGGRIPGYGTLVFHAPDSGQTAFWVSASDELHFGPTVEDVVLAMVPELRGDETE